MNKAARTGKKTRGSTRSMDKRFDAIDKKLDRVIDHISTLGTRDGLHELSNRVTHIEEALEKVLISIDRLTKAVEDLTLEYRVFKVQMERHDRWFKEIADKIGIELKP
jgi:archaellum component FlaC